MRHKFSKWLTAVAVIVAAFVVGSGGSNAVHDTHAQTQTAALVQSSKSTTAAIHQLATVSSDKREQGVDWSKYQGAYGAYGRSDDKFVISQIGGFYDGTFIPQYTYSTQVSSAIAAGKYVHTYIYGQFSTRAQADTMLDYYLPKVQTPKQSIVALDVESGTPNTDAVNYALQRITDAGYTAVLYGYKGFLTDKLDLASLAKSWPLWLAEYPDYQVRTSPDYSFFPSYDNIHVFQFTSTYKAGGLDGNVDLTGLTHNGYTSRTTSDSGKTTVKTTTSTPAIAAGQQANNTPKRDIKAGDVVKVNLGATRWATGQGIPSWVRGKTYTVSAISGTRVLLSGIMSWANRADVEILATTQTTASTPTSYRDGKWTIHAEDGTFTANRGLSVWYWPGYSATGSRYYSGESVHYYGWVRNGQYVYVAYHASDGLTHYLAVRDNGVALGTFR